MKFAHFTTWLALEKKAGGKIAVVPDQVVSLTEGIRLKCNQTDPMVSTCITTLDGKDREVLGLMADVEKKLKEASASVL